MKGINKGIVAIAVVIVVTGFVFYQYTARVFHPTKDDAVPSVPVVKKENGNMSVPTGAKEVSVTTTYDVPAADLVHNVKFTVVLDAEGRVQDVRMTEMPDDKASDKQKEFAQGLTVMIKGKKLSEITKVDKVGKSTITTDAFNAVVGDLKAKL